ncbi:hypothetical protein WA026_020231 [Henosepilachna vigintioctopunctata]|uniref:Uncharacterized protein n=1 Tax=Henosepilachna vigintioctopunctata TaxID=420089 RepID=A0AAW1TMZ8_9CUCU
MWRAIKEAMKNKKQQQTEFSTIELEPYTEEVQDYINSFYEGNVLNRKTLKRFIENKPWDTKIKVPRECSLSKFRGVYLPKLDMVINTLKKKSTEDDVVNMKLEKNIFCVMGYILLYLVNTF